MSFPGRVYGYIALLAVGLIGIAIIPIPHNPEIFLWYIALISSIYVPYLFIIDRFPREEREEKDEERILVSNDMAHFKYVVSKAINGNPIAQRDVEMRIMNMVSMELSLRYEVPERDIRERFGDVKFMERYMGPAAEHVVSMYMRRHDLKQSVPREKFLKEIEETMEAMK